jgi:glutathione S-transferase
VQALIARTDGPFKHHLDRFKYASRFPSQDREPHRAAAMAILHDWNQRLEAGGWLLGPRSSLADWALLPFVRQFRLADPAGFDSEPRLGALQAWLARFLASSELAAAMAPPLAFRQAWPSPRWIYHLALPSDWQAAQAAGIYTRSTRGLDLQEVGFIHASRADQLTLTHGRFYADAGPVLLLSIDPLRLRSAGITVLEEAPAGSDERFPHIHGPLPLEAVVAVETYRPQSDPAPMSPQAKAVAQVSPGHGS